MRSLTSLIRERGQTDELARLVEALTERSGLVMTLRDHQGRFVQISEHVGNVLHTNVDVRGSDRIGDARFFDVSGRELPIREHPAHQVRVTGEPQRRTVGIRRGEHEIWLRMAYLPVDRAPEGWSVLAIGEDVTAEVAEQRALTARCGVQDALLAIAEQSLRPLTLEGLPSAFGEPLGRLAPGSTIALYRRAGDVFEGTMLRHEPGTPTVARATRATPEAEAHWTEGKHVNLDVRDVDIYGSRIVAELRNPFRSIVTIAIDGSDGRRLALLSLIHAAPGAYTPAQIADLERAARLLAPAIEQLPAPRAAAA